MAEKIILKKSSVLGKRPTNENLIAGELGLNTNSDDPGAFFEVSDGNIVKLGPTSVSFVPPVQSPEKGESWLNLGDGSLNVGSLKNAKKVWRKVSAPFLGGGGTCVFVAPEFEFATDGLTNDGQTLPFQTLTRAILELSKKYINRVLAGFSSSLESNRYTIYLAPSSVTISNEVGRSVEDFNVDFSSNPLKEVTTSDLLQFNHPNGGIIVPFGITIQGMDLKKSVISPSYVPTYKNPALPLVLQRENQPLSSIFRCSGNSYLHNFSARDKISYSEVVSVSQKDSYALFRTERPHGLSFNENISVIFSPSVDQSTGTFTSGNYYCIPLNPFEFFLSTGSQIDPNAAPYIPFTDIPLFSEMSGPKFKVISVLKSAHRLCLVGNASVKDISDYYTKVQKAFSSFFGGKITEGRTLIDTGDFEIVGPTSAIYPDNESSNTVKNSSLYANQVNLRSEYGMCWGDFDGSLVDGFKSVIVNACTAVSLQNDPEVYEIYTTLVNENGQSEQKWWSLTQAAYLSVPVEQRPQIISEVSSSSQLDLLNVTPINNIRYFYDSLKEPESGESIGIVDIENDFRHFGFRVRNGAYGQFQSIYTIGPAIGVWALNGGICNLTNSTSNFGSISFRAEGFLGINTIGGASPNSKGFVLEGVQRPIVLTKFQAESIENKKILSLGSSIRQVYLDPANPSIQIIELNSDFSPNFILPFSLKPGSALWVESEECTYRGFFATDGGPTLISGSDDPCGSTKLRVRSSDSTIPNTPIGETFLGIPYIRRFDDPRLDFDRSYSLLLRNTLPNAVAPQVGSVLRLNQTSQQLGTNSLKPNVQFDPGILGGWGRVFTVDAVETGVLGSSPQFNYVIADTNQDLNYYLAISVSDYSRPWTQGIAFKNPTGSYLTHKNRNWYCAENNLWQYVYYGREDSFNEEIGPFSLSPFQPNSPFVDTSVLDKQEPVSRTFQGSYSADSKLEEYNVGSTYLRGATSPYPTYSTQYSYDDDDGSEDLGLCLKDVPNMTFQTSMVTDSRIIQTERLAQLKSSSSQAFRYRPAIIEFSVLSAAGIGNPKQKPQILQISSPDSSYVEYVRVVSLNGGTLKGIRLNYENSFYPTALPPEGSSYIWPKLSLVTVCDTNPVPESSLYDPEWTMTKSSVLRFFEVMGYSNTNMSALLRPQNWGSRLLSITSLKDELPENGYAAVTDKWPLEFNQPSVVIANTHTWGFTGYPNYSRGLIKYQTTDITRKLAADYQASTLWSGRLTVTGINDKGEIVQFGPQRQALTANYYDFTPPILNPGIQQIYEKQTIVEFPAQVTVFSVDDISSQFDGNKSIFYLNRGGLSIPLDQLDPDSMIVVLGAIVQKPHVDYTIQGNRIFFNQPIPEGLTCDIRVITSADSNKTLIAVPFSFKETPNNTRSTFTLNTTLQSLSIKNLDINANNTFVIIGGVEQIPLSENGISSSPWSYTINRISDEEVSIIFTEPLPSSISVDIRTFCTASYWASRSVNPVSVYSLDPLSDLFNGSKVVFDLTFNGIRVNPDAVNQDSLIFSLGGAIQIPGVSYKVENGQLIFINGADAPLKGTTTNLRIITNSEFISCRNSGRTSSNFIEWGPGLVLELENKTDALENQTKTLQEEIDSLG